ncbi:MAG: 2-oxo-4-hydroxy-4-carboxy-5-ureidoimidazoline decarboxylase [Vicinamibacterales bacterium]
MAPWQRLDEAAPDEARQLLRGCCGSGRWVERMLKRRPFRTRERLMAAAHYEWVTLDPADWLEAFSHHPMIGDRAALAARFPDTAHLSENEQAGITGAAEDVLSPLAGENLAYQERFGHIFIVCASGLTAGQMLAKLRARLSNDPGTEFQVAAVEQEKITVRRLDAIE